MKATVLSDSAFEELCSEVTVWRATLLQASLNSPAVVTSGKEGIFADTGGLRGLL